MNFDKSQYSYEEIWEVPSSSKRRFEMIRTNYSIFNHQENMSDEEINDRYIGMLFIALEALDLSWEYLKERFSLMNITIQSPFDDVLKILDHLCIGISIFDLGYNPLRHRLNVLQAWKKNKIGFELSEKLKFNLQKLDRSQKRLSLKFELQSYGGDLLINTIMKYKVCNRDEIQQRLENNDLLSEFILKRFDDESIKLINNLSLIRDTEKSEASLTPRETYNTKSQNHLDGDKYLNV